MPLQQNPSFSFFLLWEYRIREQGLTGLAEDLDKLGILSFTLFHNDSLSLSLHFFVDNKRVWLMRALWHDLHLAKAQVKLYRRCIFPSLCATAALRLGDCQLSWARTSQTPLQGSFQWKTHWRSEIPHRQFRKTHFPSLGRQMLHAISPLAKRDRNVEEEIDSSFNKPWAQLGIPRQPILLRSNFSF